MSSLQSLSRDFAGTQRFVASLNSSFILGSRLNYIPGIKLCTYWRF
jgi:hypothetical protein